MSAAARRSTFWPVLLLVCAFAAVQALWMRASHGLSIDEPFTANAIALPWSQVVAVFPHDNVPLHYVLLEAWTRLFGDSAFTLRSLSAAAFTLAVLVTGLAARAAGGTGAGLLAALLVATSTSVGLLHASTARAYALLGLMAALAVWCGVRLVANAPLRLAEHSAAARSGQALRPAEQTAAARSGQAGGTRRRWLPAFALAVITALGLFTHPLFLPFAVAVAIAATAVAPRRALVVLAAVGCGTAVYLVAWWPVLAQTLRLPTTAWMARPALVDLQNVVMVSWTSRNGFMLLGCAVTLIVLAGRRGLASWCDRPFVFCALVAALGLLLPFAASWIRPVYHPLRTPALVLPALSAAFALVLTRLSRPPLTALFIVLFAAGSLQYTVATARAHDPNPTSDSLGQVLARARCGDVIVPTGYAFSEIAYFRRQLNAPACIGTVALPAEIAAHPGWLDVRAVLARPDALDREVAALASSVRQGQRAWVFGRVKGVGHEVTDAVAAGLDRRMSLEDELPLAGSFFDSVRVYVARPVTEPSR